MKQAFKTLAGALAFAGAIQGSPAAAQYMMHLDPNIYIFASMMSRNGGDPCMTGQAMPEPKVAEARRPAQAVMQTYFSAAQGGGAKSVAFHLDKNTNWRSGGVTAGSQDLDRQRDPLAVEGNVLEVEALRFYRGGTGATALGQWAVSDPQGRVVGAYTGLFTRVKNVWRLRELTASRASDIVEPVSQYCRKPGDVMEHRLTSTKNWVESAQKSVDEAKDKLTKAVGTAAQARSNAAAKPRDERLAVAARTAERSLTYWTKQVEQREGTLGEATEKSAEAQRDSDELKRLTGEARNVRSFAVGPDVATKVKEK